MAGTGHGHGHRDLETALLDEKSHGHSHDHGHGHSHGHDDHDDHDESDEDQKRLRMAVYCALFFMIVEVVGGVYSNSLAILTDAAHMLSDVGGFVVSLVALQLSARVATQNYTYGYKQAEVLGALLSIAIVWGLTAILLWEAIPRFFNPEEIEAKVMFYISCIGFFVNLVLMKVLGHGHSHDGEGHGHSHGGGDDSVAVQAAIAHVIGDIVQSLGVCAASLCIWIKPFELGVAPNGVSKWNYADPACTVLFSILVLYTTKATFMRTIDTLMAKVPAAVDKNLLAERLEAIPMVESVHDVHIWKLGSKEVLCSAHLLVNGKENCTSVLIAAIKAAQRAGIGHSTFQTEILGEFDPALETFGNLCRNEASSKSLKLKANSVVDSSCYGHTNGNGHDHGGHEAHDHGGHEAHGHEHDGHSHDAVGAHEGHGGHSH